MERVFVVGLEGVGLSVGGIAFIAVPSGENWKTFVATILTGSFACIDSVPLLFKGFWLGELAAYPSHFASVVILLHSF